MGKNQKNSEGKFSGKTKILFKYVDAEPMQNSLALVKSDDNKEFYIGFEGTEFYEP